MNEITKYDAATCVTAGELREVGHMVPLTIPDVAWVPRSSLVLASNLSPIAGVRQSDSGSIAWDMNLYIAAPFKWVELTVSTDKAKGVSDA